LTVIKISLVGISQFGTVFVSDVFEKMGKTSQDAQNHLTVLSLCSTCVSLVVAVITG